MPADRLLERVLVFTPTGRDGPMIARILERSGLPAEVCHDMGEFCGKWHEGAGAGILAEEALAPKNRECLLDSLAQQPVWSDLPLIILTGGGHTTRSTTAMVEALEAQGNVTLLERPLRILTLVSALHAALRARRRQYEVKRLLEETRQAVEQRDQFLAMLAHELRNPLSPVRSSLEIMRLPGVDGPVVAQAREMAERQVRHMARLLDDLLDVARVSRGKIELRREVLDLVLLVRPTVEAIRPLAEARHHELIVSCPPQPLWIEGDATRLEQILTNLVNNACKYTDPGGKIWLVVERQDNEAVLRVRDNGIGIPADKLPKVFDLFVQAERRLDRSQGGIGIGLTLVKKLVELHGGSVTAFSAGPGQGSEFIVRLPALVGEPVANEKKTTAGAAAAPAARRILIVDDNEDAADSLALMLRLANQVVRVAYNGPSALKVAQEFHPDIILLDLGMPGMDGYAVARRLREHPDLQQTTLIALSGWAQEEDKRRSREVGFDHHLVKPADPDVLQALLSRLPLNGATSRQA